MRDIFNPFSKIKAAFILKYGKTEKVLLGERPIPICLDTDVLIKIHAASVNPVDFKTRDGALKIFRKYKLPLILGHDLSGEVVAIGKSVTRFQVGDLVYARPRNERIGTFAEFIAVEEKEVSLKPQNLEHIEAAGVPLVALTSYQVLKDVMKLSKGQKILIQAGSGGIGSIAIQIAKDIGAEVWTTTSTKNIDFVRSLGADHVVDYKKSNVFSELSELDAVFDTLGGDSLSRSFDIVKKGGWVVSISGTPNYQTAKASNLTLFKSLLVGAYGSRTSLLAKKKKINYSFHFMRSCGEQLSIIKGMIEEDRLKTNIDKVFPLAQTQEALELSESGRARGKIVIQIS